MALRAVALREAVGIEAVERKWREAGIGKPEGGTRAGEVADEPGVGGVDAADVVVLMWDP